jgi:hypothetical protein
MPKMIGIWLRQGGVEQGQTERMANCMAGKVIYR